MKILAVANQKGGVGKSTTAFHVVHAALEAGKRVLVGDLDKQGSLSLLLPPANGSGSGLAASTLFEASLGGARPEVISENLSIIRADKKLMLLDSVQGEMMKQPAQHLKTLADSYDVCVLDTPGLLGMKLNSSLVAADGVICPVSIGLLESAALAELWQVIRDVKTKGWNPKLQLLGIIPSKINTRSAEEMEGLASLRQKLGDAIFPITLAERAVVKQAIARRKPVWKSSPRSEAAKHWKEACNKILTSLGVMK